MNNSATTRLTYIQKVILGHVNTMFRNEEAFILRFIDTPWRVVEVVSLHMGVEVCSLTWLSSDNAQVIQTIPTREFVWWVEEIDDEK